MFKIALLFTPIPLLVGVYEFVSITNFYEFIGRAMAIIFLFTLLLGTLGILLSLAVDIYLEAYKTPYSVEAKPRAPWSKTYRNEIYRL